MIFLREPGKDTFLFSRCVGEGYRPPTVTDLRRLPRDSVTQTSEYGPTQGQSHSTLPYDFTRCK